MSMGEGPVVTETLGLEPRRTFQPVIGVPPSAVGKEVSMKRHQGVLPGGGHLSPAISSRSLPWRVLSLPAPLPHIQFLPRGPRGAPGGSQLV